MKEKVFNFTTIQKYINYTDRFSQKHLKMELNNSDLFLLLANPEEERLAGKLFEYLPYNKKVMLVKDDHGIMANILKESNSDVICDSPEDVRLKVRILHNEWVEKGQVNSSSHNIEQYSREEQTHQLALLLDKLVF